MGVCFMQLPVVVLKLKTLRKFYDFLNAGMDIPVFFPYQRNMQNDREF